MDKLQEGPDPDDIAAWRKVIEDQSLKMIQNMKLVAAAQRIGASGDKRVINSLMKEIAERMMRILRKHIGKNHRNEGWDMIEEVHHQLIEAVLKPNSADGIGLRTAFVARIKLRAADAIRREQLHSERYAYSEDEEAGSDEHKALATLNEERAHVESVLRRIADPRKVLAFRLHMDGVPRNSTKVESIATALGVSAKTAETWVKETEEEIRTILGAKS
jgi:DNA-directed RNA polymerase specialized sigma24 family protein